jgi:hypothetical protein
MLGFSHIAWVLNQVTRGGGKENIVWGMSQQQAFDDLKRHMFSTPMLSLPDLQQPFDIEIDDLEYVVGAFLTLHDHLMACHSELLLDVVRKYPTYKKEIYSIVQSYRQWRNYILMKNIIIHTDHKSM